MIDLEDGVSEIEDRGVLKEFDEGMVSGQHLMSKTSRIDTTIYNR
jgi:hypothetical protein